MSEAFESIRAGLEEAISHASGADARARVHRFDALDVKAIRAQVGMSQAEFAASFGVSLGTLCDIGSGEIASLMDSRAYF